MSIFSEIQSKLGYLDANDLRWLRRFIDDRLKELEPLCSQTKTDLELYLSHEQKDFYSNTELLEFEITHLSRYTIKKVMLGNGFVRALKRTNGKPCRGWVKFSNESR